MKYLLVFLIAFSLIDTAKGQEKSTLSLTDAVSIAQKNSYESELGQKKINLSKEQLKQTKNKQYPDFGISGQYQYLTDPNLKIQHQPNTDGSEDGSALNLHHFLLGQAQLSLPLYSGSQIRNAISADENRSKSAEYEVEESQEDIAMTVVNYYTDLYKATKEVELLKEQHKADQQRVKDISNEVKNELRSKNDLLKARLAQTETEVALEESRNDVAILNYRLVTFLRLPKDRVINIDTSSFKIIKSGFLEGEKNARSDLKALYSQQKTAEDEVKIAKSSFYPSVNLIGGYSAIDAHNILTADRAFSIGVQIAYDLSGIFKNKPKVQQSKIRARALAIKTKQAEDKVKVEVQQARNNFQLALKRFQAYQKSVDQAEENYRIDSNKFDNGLLEIRDLLDSEVTRLKIKIDLLKAKADITLQYYKLKKATGQLNEEFKN